MNRYPLWKYILIGIVLLIGVIYTLPNFYGESPAVQISAAKATAKVTQETLEKVQKALADANLTPNGVFFEQGAQQNTIRVRFDPTQTEEQLEAREVVDRALNADPKDPSYIAALNLTPNTPNWLLALTASRCISVLTFAAAFTSCCRLICVLQSPSAQKRPLPTCARSSATSAFATRASIVSATTSKSALRPKRNVRAPTT